MPTTKCSCGQELHYSADKAGLIARCRCGKPVRLPDPPPESPRKSHDQVRDDLRRAASKRRQIIAVLAFAVVVLVAVVTFAKLHTVSPARRQAAPTTVEP